MNLLKERDRQRRQLGEELREIDREIEASEGYRLQTRMNLLEKSYFVFDTSQLNLRHILNEFDVEDLLVYTLHQGLPLALAELNFGRVGSGVEVDSAIKLDVSKLKEWEHWSEKGRECADCARRASQERWHAVLPASHPSTS